jgi:hypothetical protein
MKLSSMILLLALPALAAGTSLPIHAEASRMQADGRLLDLGIYDRDSQQRLPVYRHDGRYYVAGVPGHRYQLSLQNHSDTSVLGIVSVDGVNAISGRTADWSRNDGYVLDGGSSYDVKGWRKSQSQVAGFVFADADSSYASRTGRPDNVGVIGVAVFRSRMPVEALTRDEVSSAEPESAPPMLYSAPAPSTMAQPEMAARAGKDASVKKTSAPLGTGFGQRERDDVRDVDFERASSEPDEVITLYYDTRAHLIARGVLPARPMLPRQPEAFPGRFVPDPPTGDSR